MRLPIVIFRIICDFSFNMALLFLFIWHSCHGGGTGGRAMVKRGFSHRRVTLRLTVPIRPARCGAESASRTEATLMKRWPLLLALPALVAITATARAADDPDTVLRQIRTENSKRLQDRN